MSKRSHKANQCHTYGSTQNKTVQTNRRPAAAPNASAKFKKIKNPGRLGYWEKMHSARKELTNRIYTINVEKQ